MPKEKTKLKQIESSDEDFLEIETIPSISKKFVKSTALFNSRNYKTLNMANPNVTVQTELGSINLNVSGASASISDSEFRLLISTIPSWEPGNNLAHFITSVERIFKHLENKLTPTLLFVLNNTVRLKIQGEANNFLSCVNAESWKDIKAHLLQRYGDQRDEQVLAHTLRTCVQYHNQTYKEFYVKIIESLHALIEHLQITLADPNLLAYKTYEYTNLANQVFLNGIKEPYRFYLSNKNHTTLEQNLNACHTFDNQKEQNNYYDFLRNQHKGISYQKPLNKNNFSTQLSKPQIPRQNQQTFTPKPFSGPINTPINTSNKFPTAKQVFGTNNANKNPWVQSKPASNQFKPTPMSIQSRATSFRPQHQNHFRNHSNMPPNFISEELFNSNPPTEESHFEPEYTDYYLENNDEHEFEEPEDTQENFQELASEFHPQ